MANNTNDLIAKLKVVLDKSSLKDVQKDLSKQNFIMKTKIDVDERETLNTFKDVMKGISAQLPTGELMKGFTTSLRQSIAELKELDTYLTKISKADIHLPTSELSKIGEKSLKETSSKSGFNGLLSVVNEITKKVGSVATTNIAEGLLSGITKNFGRPKMFGLCFENCRTR